MLKFLKNTGDYFSSNYFDEDFTSKVLSKTEPEPFIDDVLVWHVVSQEVSTVSSHPGKTLVGCSYRMETNEKWSVDDVLNGSFGSVKWGMWWISTWCDNTCCGPWLSTTVLFSVGGWFFDFGMTVCIDFTDGGFSCLSRSLMRFIMLVWQCTK